MAWTYKSKKDGTTFDVPDNVELGSPKFMALLEKARTTNKAPPQSALERSRSMGQPSPTVGMEPQQPFDIGKQVAGDVGAVARGVAQGPLSLVTVPLDFLVALGNQGKNVYDNLVTGKPIDQIFSGPSTLLPSQAIQKVISLSGLPPEEQQTELQKILQAFTGGVSGAGAVAGAAGAVAPVLTGTAKGVAQTLAAQPVAQMAGGGMAALGSEGAGRIAEPLGPEAEAAARLAGGVMGGAVGAGLAPGGIKTAVMESVPSPKVVSQPQTPTQEMASAEKIGKLVQKAAGGSGRAKDLLAEMASVNPEAKAAADRLGISLPVDVFSDSPQVMAAIGLTRSQVGSEAESAWRTTVRNAAEKADDVLNQFDTVLIEGGPSTAVVSQKIKDSLTNSRKQLSEESKSLYSQVDDEVPKSASASMNNLKTTLDEITAEVGQAGMTAQEKRMLTMISDEVPTYGRLIREKGLIGKALAGKESPYGSMEEATLKRLYGALSADQLESVSIYGGEELAKKLQAADALYTKERKLGKAIVETFGKDIEGGIGKKLQSAMTTAAKSDEGAFKRLIEVVPEDLRKETIATALSSVVRSARGSEAGGFGFSEYAKIYKGLRENPEVYGQVVKYLGKESGDVLRDLYEVSKRVTDARANVITTGKANQAILQGMVAESLMGKVLTSPVGRATTTMAGAAAGGPIGAGAATMLSNLMTSTSKDHLAKAGKLFTSEKFQRLATEAATKPKVGMEVVNGVANDKAFIDFSKNIGLKDFQERQAWILSALAQPQQEPKK